MLVGMSTTPDTALAGLVLGLFQKSAQAMVLGRLESGTPRQDYRILTANEAFARLLGLSGPVSPDSLASEVFGASPPPGLAQAGEALATDTPVKLEYASPSGTFFELWITPLGQDKFSLVFTDLTGQRRLQAENDNILLNSLDCISVSTLDYWFIKLNPAWTRVLGWSPEELMSRPYFEFIHPDDLNATVNLRQLEAPYTGIEGFENRYRHKDGSYRWLAWNAFMTTDRVYAVARDVTARKENERKLQDYLVRADEQLQSSQRLVQLGGQVAGITHDAMTPLGLAGTTADYLAGCADRLAALHHTGDGQSGPVHPDGPAVASLLQDVRTATRLITGNLARATEILGSFKQLAADQTSGIRRRFTLDEVVRSTVASFEPRFRPTPYRLAVDCPAGLVADSCPGVLSQILSNLVMNALLHGLHDRPAGQVTIAASPDARPDWISLTVQDDGWGIPEHCRSEVFAPFFTTAGDRGGTGLGLTLVKGLVTQRLGGEVRLETRTVTESPEDHGTRVSLRFPLNLP